MNYLRYIFCALTVLIFSNGHAQKNVRIGFLDLDKVLEAHKGYAQSSQELEVKISEWRNEIDTKQQDLVKQKEALELERPLLTDEIYEERAEDIAFEQEKLDQYIQQRFGTDGDWIKQKVSLAQPAQDEILTAIKEVADDRNLDYVFDSTADILVLHSEKKYDISDLVIGYIEQEDKKKAREELVESRKEEQKAKRNPAAEKRRKLLEERKAERERKLAARQKERDAKKKATETEDESKVKLSPEEKRAERERILQQKKEERIKALEARKKELEEKRNQAKK